MKSKQELLAELRYFTGTTQIYHLPHFTQYFYTDGVRYLAMNAGGYWLLEHIFIHQSVTKIAAEGFQVWKLVKKESAATITVEDGNGNVIETFEIPFTDFPLEEFSLWMEGNTLLLPSEH